MKSNLTALVLTQLPLNSLALVMCPLHPFHEVILRSLRGPRVLFPCKAVTRDPLKSSLTIVTHKKLRQSSLSHSTALTDHTAQLPNGGIESLLYKLAWLQHKVQALLISKTLGGYLAACLHPRVQLEGAEADTDTKLPKFTSDSFLSSSLLTFPLFPSWKCL